MCSIIGNNGQGSSVLKFTSQTIKLISTICSPKFSWRDTSMLLSWIYFKFMHGINILMPTFGILHTINSIWWALSSIWSSWLLSQSSPQSKFGYNTRLQSNPRVCHSWVFSTKKFELKLRLKPCSTYSPCWEDWSSSLQSPMYRICRTSRSWSFLKCRSWICVTSQVPNLMRRANQTR